MGWSGEEAGWAGLSHAGRVDVLVALEREIAGVQARQLRLLAVMAADPVVPVGAGEDRQWVREDVACALRLSFGHAASRLRQAAVLGRVPQVVAMLAAGDITAHHARVLAEAIDGLDGATAAAVTDRVLDGAAELTLSEFGRAVRRAVLALAPVPEAEAAARNVADRRVSVRPAGVGVSTLWALLPDEGAAAVMAAVTALAGGVPAGDERTLAQRQADALVHLALDHPGPVHPGLGSPAGPPVAGPAGPAGLGGVWGPGEQRLRPAVNVCVALSTLVGLDDEPGELAGIGPISAALARRLAADPSGLWRRLLTDERGRLLDYGRQTYRPPAVLARHVLARDRTCRFPHCTRPARGCDIDHRIGWAEGGTTDADNLQVLCGRHHHLKHETSWQTRIGADGVTRWTSPTGHTYLTRPATYPVGPLRPDPLRLDPIGPHAIGPHAIGPDAIGPDAEPIGDFEPSSGSPPGATSAEAKVTAPRPDLDPPPF